MSLVTITPKTTTVTCAAGTSVDCVFGIYNNTSGSIRVSAETLGDLKEKDWLGSLGDVEMDLPEKGQQDVTVKVTAPVDAAQGDYTFQLRVYDVNDPEKAVKSDLVKVEVPGAEIPDEKKKEEDDKKPNWALIIGLIAGGVVLLAGLGILLYFLLSGSSTVPDVVNMTLDDAISELRAADLDIGDVFEEVSGEADVQPGTVLSQKPAAGTEITDEMIVQLRVEAISIEVPSLVGRSLTDAIEELAASGLAKGSVAQKRAGNARGGTVLEQDPAAESAVLPGTPINLVVAQEEILVRDLTGLDLARAQAWVRQANLTVGRVSEKREAGQAGIVLSHNPSGGKEVSAGQRIDFVVRAKTVIVPNVANNTYTNAKEQLEQLGLKIKTNYKLTRRARAGTVLSQTPTPNSRVSIGSVVSLTVEQSMRVFIPNRNYVIDSAQISSIVTGTLKTRKTAEGGLRVVPPDEDEQ